MIESRFYTPENIKPLYNEIVPAYQTAFAGEPWYEVSKCIDESQRCAGGLSSTALGATCEMCGKCPVRPAYERDELIDRFESDAATRPTIWYTEESKNGLTLAAIAWEATPQKIAQEKFGDVPEMAIWLTDTLGDSPIVWLDDIFANRTIKTSGNLRNFGLMNSGFMEQMGNDTLAFRTINKKMLAASKRDFGAEATIFEKEAKRPELRVPDRREFVVIKNTSGEIL